ncbi:MAG: DUF898 family protein [Alphaproteobacteria bacterium]
MDSPPVETARFVGKRWLLAEIAFRNTCLELVTLGFYRFWAKTRLRQYFWGNLLLAGEPLEYSGTATELLKGFFVALVALMGLSAVQSVVIEFVPASEKTASVLYNVVLLALIQVALYRMWRYRLTRTSWRGVRFGLDGSTWTYVKRATGWWLVTIITVGLAYPWARMALMRYRITHMRFGDRNFSFTGEGEALFARWMVFYLLAGVMVGGTVAVSVDLETVLKIVNVSPLEREPEVILRQIILPVLSSIAAVLVVAYGLFVWYRAGELRYALSNVEFGSARFTSALRPWTIVGNTLCGVVPIVLALSILGGGIALADNHITLWVVLAVLVWVLVGRVVSIAIVQFAIVRHAAATLSVSEPDAFAVAAQTAGPRPRYGEGLADALDVGAF